MKHSLKLKFELIEMLDSEDLTDCAFQLSISGPNTEDKIELIRAHKLILSVFSPVFKTMLSEKWSSNNEPIKIKDTDPELFKMFIRFKFAINI